MTVVFLQARAPPSEEPPGWQREKDTDPSRWGDFEYVSGEGERIVIKESYASTSTRVRSSRVDPAG